MTDRAGVIVREMSKSFTRFLISAFLVAITIAVYWRTLDHDFVVFCDDGHYVTSNALVRAGPTPDGLVRAFTTIDSANWHPLTWISHMLDCRLYGLNPTGHHLTNLLLHAVNTVLLFLVLSRMTGAVWRSAFVAALLGVHPLHVESVAWISERKDVLSALFWMLTMFAYVRYVERPGLSRYSLVILAFALGLMSKPMLVTLPLVLLLLDYWPLGRLDLGNPNRSRSLLKLGLEKVPLLALSAASSVITFLAQRSGGAVRTAEEFPLRIRLMNAPMAYVKYIAKMVWPSGLAPSYPHQGADLPAWQAAAAGFVLIAVTALVIKAARRRPHLPVGWLWYVGTLVPVIGIVQVGGQAMADRYTYIPLIGLFVMISWGVPEALRGVGVWKCGSVGDQSPPYSHTPIRPYACRRVLPIVGAAIIVALAACARLQTGHWRDSITLLTRAVEVTPTDYKSLDALGMAFAAQRRYDEAIRSHRAALKLSPEAPFLHAGFAVTLAEQGNIEEAVREFQEALRLDPEFGEAHYNLAKALELRGDLNQAASHYSECLRLKTNTAETHASLGNILLRQGRPADAAREYRAALSVDPYCSQARTGLAAALQYQGRTGESIEEARRAIRASPDSATAHYNLGVGLQNENMNAQAAREYEEAIRIRPDYAEAHNNLALAYYDMGRYTEAWREVHQCVRCNGNPHPGFVKLLAKKMPDPAR